MTSKTQVNDNASQLLNLHDDLNNFLFALEFHFDVLANLIESAEDLVLPTERKRAGLTLTHKHLIESGRKVSGDLTTIRKQISQEQDPPQTDPQE
ncbi:MAG: hypothetical protein ACRBCK_07025 [Alphaproteobacteria bacterium]